MPGKKFEQIDKAFNAEKEKTQQLFSSIIACVHSKFQWDRLMLLARMLHVNFQLKDIERDFCLSTGLREIDRAYSIISCPMLEKSLGLREAVHEYSQRVKDSFLLEQPGERFDETQLEQAKLDLENYKLEQAQLRSSLLQWLFDESMPVLEETRVFISSWKELSEEVFSEYEFSIMDARLKLLALNKTELIDWLNRNDRDLEDEDEDQDEDEDEDEDGIIADDVVINIAWQLLNAHPDQIRQYHVQRLAREVERLRDERAELKMDFAAAAIGITRLELVNAITHWFEVNQGLRGLESLEGQQILESLENENGFDLIHILEFMQNRQGQIGLSELLEAIFNPGNPIVDALAAKMELFRAEFLQIERELVQCSQLLARTPAEQGGLGGAPVVSLASVMTLDVDGLAADEELNNFADAAEKPEEEEEKEEEAASASGGHHGHHDRRGDDDGAGGPGGSGMSGGADSSSYYSASGPSSNGGALGADDGKFDKSGAGGHFDSVLEFHVSKAMNMGHEVISDIQNYPDPVMLQKIAEFIEVPGLSEAPFSLGYQPHLSMVGVVDKSGALCA